ncbi:MAG: hypothetical protein WCO09_04585 [bacterium]
MTDRLKKQYPEDTTVPGNLPDWAPEEHPAPWRVGGLDRTVGRRYLIYDAHDVLVMKIFFLDYVKEEVQEFIAKINNINGTQTEKLLLSDYFCDIGYQSVVN